MKFKLNRQVMALTVDQFLLEPLIPDQFTVLIQLQFIMNQRPGTGRNTDFNRVRHLKFAEQKTSDACKL